MLHYANWSSQLTITLLIGQSDELQWVSASENIRKRQKVPFAKKEQGEFLKNVKSDIGSSDQ